MTFPIVSGTLFSAVSCMLFALINPSTTYWAFGFPSAILSVFGADFVFTSGTIFIAKTVLHHEQSVAGALFQTMTQVRCLPYFFDIDVLLSTARDCVRLDYNYNCI